ncbi:MAG: tail fiber assembly protein [Rhizorhabdus sp.]
MIDAGDDAICIDVPDTAAIGSLFYDGANVVQRQEAEFTVDRTVIIADGVDAAHVTGLPDPCWLIVGGERRWVEGGSADVTVDHAARLALELGGAHRSALHLVEAKALATLTDELRAERDARLATSDKFTVSDFPVSEEERADWMAYRQALRDLPDNQPDATILDVEWPVPPDPAKVGL